MEEHFETYDGEEKMDLISPIIRNVEFKGDANNFGKMKFHVDFDLPVMATTENLKLIPEIVKAISNIKLEKITN